jgi:dihydroorotate dehydrogenase (fumarate)
MANLATNYMGLSLKNPIIVASSGLTKSVSKIEACQEAGAGAVIIKSLFEEVLAQEDLNLVKSTYDHPEAYDYMRAEIKMQYGPQEYCDLISKAKQKVDIPVIASINCISSKWWADYAQKIEEAGADALELNVFSIATEITKDGQSMEELYYEIIETVKSKISIPVSMKIGKQITSLPYLVNQLDKRGLNGLTIFNRFTEPDIDINKLELKTTFAFSTHEDLHQILRWVALLSPWAKSDISATTGIHSSEGIIKLLLAGAATTQLASVLYNKGLGVIKEFTAEIEQWMDGKNFKTIDDFKGKLNFGNTYKYSPDLFLRTQFMDKVKDVE